MILETRKVSKSFGSIEALVDVDLTVEKGEIFGIAGPNGAGKSTLIKILTGVYQPTSGTMELGGEPLVMNSHSDAIDRGIDSVYQTLAIADHLAPAANMFLGSELTKRFLGIRYLDNKRMRVDSGTSASGTSGR